MQDCGFPELIGNTVQALLNYHNDAIDAIRKCNTDKSAMRAWAVQFAGEKEDEDDS